MGHERCCAQVVISIDDLMPAPLLGELQIVLVGEPGFPVDDDCHGCTQLTTNYSTRDTVDTASRKGRQYMEMAPRLELWPGLCLTLVVYSLNMFGDAVRDLLDPRLRGGGGRLGADAGGTGSV